LEPENLSKVLSPDDVAQTVSAIIHLPPHALISEVEVRPTNPK
jgi:NADP-dependent 3-hydroxy acid dehydrogenase YdfG